MGMRAWHWILFLWCNTTGRGTDWSTAGRDVG